MKVRLKRIYEESVEADGYRILVDRLWPRGVSKKNANLDLWLKEIAPSTEFRTWFDHNLKKWTEFKRKYKTELSKNVGNVAALKKILKTYKQVTFLYAAKDEEQNEAILIKDFFHR